MWKSLSLKIWDLWSVYKSCDSCCSILYIRWPINVLAFNKPECLSWHSAVNLLSQEEDLQEIIAKISSKRVEYDQARAQMAELKSAFEEAEQEYKQHKQLINTAAEEADVKKVETKLAPLWLVDFLILNTFLPGFAWCFKSRLSCNILWAWLNWATTLALSFCPAGRAEQDWSGGDEMQASWETLWGETQCTSLQHKDSWEQCG